MAKIITLYHGSCHTFDRIDLAKGKPFKDFGPGFYVSENRRHAERLAIRNRAREWMRFVVQNRTSNRRIHDYDIVSGPTANDNTSNAIQLFFAGAYGDVTKDSAVDMLITNIEPGNLPYQYYFGTEKSVKLLKYLARDVIP